MKDLNNRRQVKDFPDPAKSGEYGFDKPSAVVSVWVEGVQKDEEDDKEAKKDQKKDEKKDAEAPKLKSDKPTVKLTFGKSANGVVYVSREADNDKTIVTVPDTLLKRVDQGPLA